MGHSFLDRYHRGTSTIHRLDPRLKLLATLAFVLATTVTPSRAWPSFALLAALLLGVTLLSRIPLAKALAHSAIALPFAGMVALSLPFTRAGQVVWAWRPFGWTIAVTDEGLHLFATVIAKAWLSVGVSGLLVMTTPVPDMLKAMHALHAPPVLTSVIAFMIRYLHLLVDEGTRLQTARQARSAGSGGSVLWRIRVLGGMIGSLFIRSYERSERIYAAMLSRGFAGEIRSLTHLTWQTADAWAGMAWATALVAAMLLGRLWP
jgi:cobalt/nickel transport system permease protein